LKYSFFRIIFFIFLLCAFDGFGQANPLDSVFSISAQNKSIYSVLQELSNKAGIYFTYNSEILYEDSTVTLQVEDERLYSILAKLFPDSVYVFQLVDKHIIITEKEKENIELKVEIEPFVTLSGIILDKVSRKPLQFASVSVFNKEIGTISNTDGSFVLKVPWEYRNDSIAFSYVGYETQYITIHDLRGKSRIIYLDRQYIAIQEVIIRNVQPLALIKMSLDKVDDNYIDKPVILNAFYREAVKKNNAYVLYSEALIDINSMGYVNSIYGDQVRLRKSRKIVDYENYDTVLLKLKAGVNSSLMLDFMKHPISFISPDHFTKYYYNITDISNYNKQLVYVVKFEQYSFIPEPYYEGEIYIDVNSLAIIGADFSININRINKAAPLFVVKKTRKVDVRPVYAKYKVEYKEINGKYYLNYVRGDLKLKVKNKEKFFATTFETFIELAVNEIDTANTKRFQNKELLRTTDIFFDNISNYSDDFWENYNFIPPEESIEEAIRRIQSNP